MPSQLASCAIEVAQCSQSQDYAGWFSLAVTIFGWPIVYILGLRSNRKIEINKSIDQLDDAVENLRKFAASLESKEFANSDYQTMVAYFSRIKNICSRIEQLDSKLAKPAQTLRELKKVATDELFDTDKKLSAHAKILRIEIDLVNHYKKSM
ncbi:hypothetical protein [Vibrio fluvialis]|uniref:hypothetical protein n=1 Tax=Vibrio fluvialis TaxID=676 RepID=UPI00192CABB1|nr:hypothetical protein [Vibrio fluvialis]EKO3992773.1 hypothetical protein [Vibrio fluvialis]MBL4276299.1 hypothetical protein [Vibrio fluvialis]MBY8212250.1 hypothetical protein [Vibrio fluvialis]MCG6363855.1 hypothetical protein [Vibrio fluvialis]